MDGNRLLGCKVGALVRANSTSDHAFSMASRHVLHGRISHRKWYLPLINGTHPLQTFTAERWGFLITALLSVGQTLLGSVG